MVRCLDPGNWLALEVGCSDGKPQRLKRQDDGTISTVYTSVVGTGMSDWNGGNGERGRNPRKLGFAAGYVVSEARVSARRSPAYNSKILKSTHDPDADLIVLGGLCKLGSTDNFRSSKPKKR